MCQPAQVQCYSGHSYAERPLSFHWQGEVHEVKKIEKEWLEPGRRHFLARTESERLFELCYHEEDDEWSAVEVVKGV